MHDLQTLWACPSCHGSLHNKNGLYCSSCGTKYRLAGEVPVFLKKKLSRATLSVGGFRDKLRKHPRFFSAFEKVHAIMGPPDSTSAKQVTLNGKKVDWPAYELLRNSGKKKILNIGSSPVKAYEDSVNLDIDLFDNVDVVADGKQLPFKNNSFDLIFIEMVLEHVDESEKVIAEAYRVLKKGGKMYVSIPFMHVFHGSPNDFNRYTLNGLRRRFELQGLKVTEAAVLSGPSAAMSQMLRNYLAMLFSFKSDFLFSFFLNVFGWITFPIKYLDWLMNHHPKAHLMANTIYAIGVK